MSLSREDLDAGRVDLVDPTDPAPDRIPPTHPGEILRDEFLDPLRITPYRLAVDIGVAPNRITAILAGERAITADTSLRFARYFGMSDGFWLRLQERYDLDVAKDELGDRLDREVKPRAAARDRGRRAALAITD